MGVLCASVLTRKHMSMLALLTLSLQVDTTGMMIYDNKAVHAASIRRLQGVHAACVAAPG